MPFTEPVSAASAPPSLVASAPSTPVEIALPPAVSAPASISSTSVPQERQPVASAKQPAKTPAKSGKASKQEKKGANKDRREKVVVEENSRKRVIVGRWRERMEDDEDRMRGHASPPSQGLGGIFGILFR
jgi:hypothetical protein